MIRIRHTIAITDHVPMLVKDVPDLKPFFDILKVWLIILSSTIILSMVF